MCSDRGEIDPYKVAKILYCQNKENGATTEVKNELNRSTRKIETS